MNPLLLFALIVSLGINISIFIPAFIFKTDKLTDISYSITFMALGLLGFALSSMSLLHRLLFAAVLVWAMRLGSFLLFRVWRKGKDARFDYMRNNFWAFLRFWLLQAVSVFVIMLAAFSGFMQPNPQVGAISWIGVGIWALGLAIESIADLQKYIFSTNPKNANKWIDEGLWRASRHPNYLGEIMVWIGVFLIVAPALPIGQLFIAILSPLYITGILLFVSGIPILEKSAVQKWSEHKEFQKYQAEVPKLLPTVMSIKRLGTC